MARPLSTSEAARLLRVSEAKLRELARAALGRRSGRGRRWAFDFADLVVLRTAKELLERDIPLARIAEALGRIRSALPEEGALTGVRVVADGGEVAIRTDTGWVQPVTGQSGFDFAFALDAFADDVATLPEAPPDDDALAAFERGLTLEDEDPAGAIAAYGEALAIDPALLDATLNCGRLVHESGDARGAVRIYREALGGGPEDPVLHFNLALALEDAQGPAAAIAHDEQAIAIAPDFGDAHYNLAGLYEALGRRADALRHYREAQRLL